ncbi:type IX secretion/gliding motility protein PorT/SprT [Porphyromonas gingivicanis]|uniref:type IX secretion/gliding motility protein PorT/SprT n=1 Tax=Porphyromonas gingivicanis TaxID=266762 RepID=UPI001F2E2E2B|nr:porin family protein [Porphyromonas gingivicanis]
MHIKILMMSSFVGWRNQYNLLAILRGLLFLMFFFCSVLPLSAQKEVPMRRPYADYRTVHLGFHVGMHTQDLVITNSGFVRNPSTPEAQPLYATVANYTPGFSVGLIVDYTIVQNLELRLQPTLHLSERQITYSNGNQEIERLGFRSNIIEVPVMLKYASRRLNNVRPYIIGGVYGGLQVGQRKMDAVHFKTMDYGIRIGVGCDFYLPFFKLCPELSFSYGLPDVIERNRPDIWDDHRYDYTQAMSRASSRMILLTFNFE